MADLDVKVVSAGLEAVSLGDAGDDVDHVALVRELRGVVSEGRPVLGSVLQQLDQDLHLLRLETVLAETLNQLQQELSAQLLQPLVTLESVDDVLDQTELTTQHPENHMKNMYIF